MAPIGAQLTASQLNYNRGFLALRDQGKITKSECHQMHNTIGVSSLPTHTIADWYFFIIFGLSITILLIVWVEAQRTGLLRRAFTGGLFSKIEDIFLSEQQFLNK